MNKILTITMNPSIDISYKLDSLKLDTTNRTKEVRKTAGGKGLNVTRVLKQLNEDVIASGLLGGKHGEFIAEKLIEAGIDTKMYKISGETRNCIAILHENGMQTEILEQGPAISEDEANRFIDFYKNVIKNVGVVAISGSLPNGMKSDYYVNLIKLANESSVKVVLDTSGKYLINVLNSSVKPYVIKPNCEELSDILGYTVKGDNDSLKEALDSNLFNGIEWVIVSLGKDGCFAKHANKYFKVSIPKVDAVNPVGSGDSTVAGISSALANNEDEVALLKKANTLGILNAMEKLTGYVNIDNYEKIYNNIEVVDVSSI